MSTPISSAGARNIWGGFTRLSKGLSTVLVVGFLVAYFLPSSLPYFALNPGKTIPMAWNLLTAAFLEDNFVKLLVNIAAVLVLSKIMEPIWGTKEFVKFILAVNLMTAASTFMAMIICYYFTFYGGFLYTPIYGFHGIVAGLLVAVKQLMPDQEIALFYILRFRAKWLPSIVVLLTVPIAVGLGKAIEYVPFVVFGAFSSWIYLRFYQAKADGSVKGDHSDDFAFATFFPEFLQPIVGTIAAILGRLFCGRREKAPGDVAANLAAGLPLPGSDPIDASRRRERGARALEERLSKAAEATSVPTSSVSDSSAPPAADDKV